MMKKIVLLVLLLSVFVGCVPNKDLTYLQGTPQNEREIRKLNNTPYRLQVEDAIFIEINAVDEDLVKMFSKNSNTQNNSGGNGGNQSFNSGEGYLRGYSVDNKGNIRLPYLGEMNVLGYTTVEVRKKLEKELWKMFKDKNDVFVTVKLAGIKFNVIGEIENPGPKVIYQNHVTIFDAIAFSGDITLVGNRKEVKIYRKSIEGNKVFTIDLTKVDALDSDLFYIKPNDIINVTPIKQKSLGTGTTGLQSLTTLLSVFSLVTSTILLVRNL
ncbi:polysaccharide export outer membrane protein [Lutibacter sp. Hel_I_33_5]|uniref:polysaccharide biosynthesis/export family protein n=1 Tax=Lutibacter sp. Hel_I_33_5 TaxID=1566289 RepID=UPI0011AAD5CD|nr:polysaccharide biosynthesis/export family protein [Lutibacter sp. Hel_I_33_5]TVZ55181.1 polysaccharide export outer membrane protein [Lutibacter sp. Hel_I_33_5]